MSDSATAPNGSVRLEDSRRLTGANLYWERPAAIIDLACDEDPRAFIETWRDAVEELLREVGHGAEHTTWRTHAEGASLLISAPIDALYSMCELNELAFELAKTRLAGQPPADLGSEIQRLRREFEEEANPPLLALQTAATQRAAPFLWDDDAVSVGQGTSARVFEPRDLPAPEVIDWAGLRRVPVGLVTGTNGKSTTVRMAAAILSAAGCTAGLTSTDWIRLGDEILDTGDYSGTGGARTLLRHPQTEAAVLETARGGLLRRGLGVDRAAAAVITNVGADHLGEYGINTVEELIEAKFIVRKALFDDAPLILNADDAGIVAFARDRRMRADQRIVWTSLEPENPVIREHLAAGGGAALLDGDGLVLAHGQRATQLIDCAAVPATQGGAARHNVHNALSAAALCDALGADLDAIRKGLMAFRGDAEDNPGRGNWFEAHGVRILLDFAHNEHGFEALTEMLTRLPGKRRVLLMSQAGDRSDELIERMTLQACTLEPARLLLCDLPGYERGREPGDVPALIETTALAAGIPREAIERFRSPTEAVAAALAGAQAGDLLALLVLTEREQALDLIRDYTAKPA